MYGGLNWSPLGGEATRLGQRVIVCVELKLKTSFILSGGQSMVIIKDKGSRVTFFTEAKKKACIFKSSVSSKRMFIYAKT